MKFIGNPSPGENPYTTSSVKSPEGAQAQTKFVDTPPPG